MRLYLILLMLIVASCTSSSKKSVTDSVQSLSKDSISGTIDKSQSPEQTALQFYNWYLKEVYAKSGPENPEGPEVKITPDSIYQIIPNTYFDKLKKTGFFSNSFYENELHTYRKCDTQLKKVKLADVDKCGCSPTDLVDVNNNDCDFLTYKTWTGGQGESINNAKIIKGITNGNTSVVTMELGGEGNPAYSHPKVFLINESGMWRISKIELKY